jgi:hypothetical protein
MLHGELAELLARPWRRVKEGEAYHGLKGVVQNSPPKLGGVARSAGVVTLDETYNQAGKAETFRALEPPRLRRE